jgi:histidinol-phosphate aminotransferase
MRILGAASAAATTFPALAAVQNAPASTPKDRRRGASDMDDMRQLPPGTVIISSNENPLGPAQSALTAIVVQLRRAVGITSTRR